MLKALDFSVFMAYLLIFLSFLLCVIYGIVNWNKGAEVSKKEALEEEIWEKEEKVVEEELGGNV